MFPATTGVASKATLTPLLSRLRGDVAVDVGVDLCTARPVERSRTGQGAPRRFYPRLLALEQLDHRGRHGCDVSVCHERAPTSHDLDGRRVRIRDDGRSAGHRLDGWKTEPFGFAGDEEHRGLPVLGRDVVNPAHRIDVVASGRGERGRAADAQPAGEAGVASEGSDRNGVVQPLPPLRASDEEERTARRRAAILGRSEFGASSEMRDIHRGGIDAEHTDRLGSGERRNSDQRVSTPHALTHAAPTASFVAEVCTGKRERDQVEDRFDPRSPAHGGWGRCGTVKYVARIPEEIDRKPEIVLDELEPAGVGPPHRHPLHTSGHGRVRSAQGAHLEVVAIGEVCEQLAHVGADAAVATGAAERGGIDEHVGHGRRPHAKLPGAVARKNEDRALAAMRSYWDDRARVNAAWYVDTSLDFTAPDMVAFFETGRRIVSEALDGETPHPNGGLAVEIGSGLGRVCLALADRFERVVGIDVSSEMVTRARELVDAGNVEFVLGDGATLAPVEDGSADLVLSFTVFQHIPDVKVIEDYIVEAGRILRPGGVLVFQWNNEAGSAAWRVRRMALGALQRSGVKREQHMRHDPAFLGSRVPLRTIETALARGGLTLERTRGLGTLYAWAWATKQ